MTVHLAGSLPSDELNGLGAIERKLLSGHLAGDKHLVIGVMKVTGTKATEKEGFRPNPIVSFEHIEPVTGALEKNIHDVLLSLLGERTGATQLKFPDMDEEPDEPETLALAAGPGYHFKVVDSAPGRFDFLLCTEHADGVRRRSGLIREEWSEIPPGDYQLHHLDDAFRSLADVLIHEWETDTDASSLDDGVVDAEVVDEDEAGA